MRVVFSLLGSALKMPWSGSQGERVLARTVGHADRLVCSPRHYDEAQSIHPFPVRDGHGMNVEDVSRIVDVLFQRVVRCLDSVFNVSATFGNADYLEIISNTNDEALAARIREGRNVAGECHSRSPTLLTLGYVPHHQGLFEVPYIGFDATRHYGFPNKRTPERIARQQVLAFFPLRDLVQDVSQTNHART